MATMTSRYLFHSALPLLAGLLLSTAALSPAGAQQAKVRIIQTNFAGDRIDIIDSAANKVVGRIAGIEAGHGVAAAPDGSRIYVSEEGGKVVDVIDGKT